MKTSALCILFTFFGVVSLTAQEQESESFKHLLTGAFGYTFIPKATSIGGTEAKGIFVPSVGLDYFYRINPKWEVGTMMDLELSDYLIFDKDLERDRALVISAIASYSLTSHINVYGGGGIELEKHHNLGVIRMGGEYAFKFKNNWLLAPGFFYDIKESYDTWSLAIAFGKEF